jgi:hypothetical protein
MHPQTGPGPDQEIDCIDCGGRCHLLSSWPADDPPQPGDIMVYRCSECGDRWDLVLAEERDEGEERDE